MKIRPVEERDLESLAEIFMESFNNANVGENWNKKSALRFIEYWMRIQPDMFFLAEEANALIGGIVTNVKPWWVGNVILDTELIVKPSYQKKGIGKELCKKLLKEGIEKHNIQGVYIVTFAEKDSLINWYSKLGLKQDENWKVMKGKPEEVLEKLKWKE